MKSLFILVILITIPAYICNAQQINVDSYLNNRGWMRAQLNCLLDRGFCDDTGNVMKGLAGYFITTRCKDCNPEMKQATRRATAHLQKYYRRDWQQLNAKYKSS